MMDTHDSVKKRFYEMMMSRSSVERLRMGCSMFDSAKEIVRSSIMCHDPQSSSSEIKKKIFLRLYEKDFNPDQKKRIVGTLS